MVIVTVGVAAAIVFLRVPHRFVFAALVILAPTVIALEAASARQYHRYRQNLQALIQGRMDKEAAAAKAQAAKDKAKQDKAAKDQAPQESTLGSSKTLLTAKDIDDLLTIRESEQATAGAAEPESGEVTSSPAPRESQKPRSIESELFGHRPIDEDPSSESGAGG